MKAGLPSFPLGRLLFAIALGLMPSRAEDSPPLTITVPGGMPGWPVMTGIRNDGTNVTVTWDGPAGYYQLWQATNLNGPSWEKLGSPTFSRTATVTNPHGFGFLRVKGPEPHYAGSRSCQECHGQIHEAEQQTAHTHALETLPPSGQTNATCLPCHTVGFGLPTGFVDEATTPHLAGVQCENCHGPAALHAGADNIPSFRPRVEFASTVCGGCHTGSHHPTYDEWAMSGHATIIPNVNSATADRCGRCHSGPVRLQLLSGQPAPEQESYMGVVCATCHDPHEVHVHTNVLTGVVSTNQLRNPTASTNDYFVTTSGALADQYDPSIQICAQCHNHRGASWDQTSRPPHHSPQYNMLIGTVGELLEGQTGYLSGHARFLDDQCVTCHMQTEEFVSEEEPAVTGHTFAVDSFAVCQRCHAFPQDLVDFTQGIIATRINELNYALNLWGETRAPEPLRAEYGPLAWEYTHSGDLSEGDGPTTGEQALIPDNIKKARFNLYLVLHDASMGVHNGKHALALLDAADTWVHEEMNKVNE